MLRFIRNEPAVVVSILVAAANIVGMTVTGEGVEALRAIVESLVILIGGGVVRQSVTPVAKLAPR